MDFLVITYDGLPANSGGAHSLKGKNLIESWEKAINFINSISFKQENRKNKLQQYLGCVKTKKYIIKNKLEFEIFPQKRHVSLKEHFLEWEIPNNKIDKVNQFLDEIKPQPEYFIGPIRFECSSKIYLNDLITGSILNGQESICDFDDGYGHYTPISNFKISVTDKVHISIWLVLPFKTIDKNLKSYISKIIEIAPFKISDKHWKIWNLTKSNKIIGKKIDLSLLR